MISLQSWTVSGKIPFADVLPLKFYWIVVQGADRRPWRAVCWHWNIRSGFPMFVNPDFQDFTLLWSSVLIQLLLPLLTGCDKFGWEHVADNSASPTWGQLLVSLSTRLAVCEVRCCALCAIRLSFNQSVSFMLPKIVCILMRKNIFAFYACGFFFVFLLLVFYGFLGPDRHFLLKLVSDGSDGHESNVHCCYISPN